MKNKETKSLICYAGIAIIVVAFLMSATSCSTRKVNKSEVKEKTEVTQVDSSKTETKTETNNVLIDTTSTTEIEVTPIDNTKPIEINGKKYVNSRIKVKRVKNGVSITNEKKVAYIKQKAVKTNIVANKEATKKETERKPDYSWWWLIVIIGVCYLIYRKYLRHWI